MVEVADTVDDAIARLSASASTDDVWDATIGFSAREIASSAARRTLAGGSGTSALSAGGHRLRMGDPLTPVVASGIGHSIGQAQDAPSIRTFLVNGSPGTVVSQLGSDNMVTYNPGPFQRVGVAVHSPSISILWTPTTDSNNTATDDHVYGLPGAAVWETTIGTNNGTKPYRLSQRWYSVPGITDVLFLEIQFAPDWTLPSQQVFAQPVNIAVAMEVKSDRVEATDGYDATLDGIGMNGQGASSGYPTYTFLRCLTHDSTGHKYTASMNANYDFGAGSISGSPVDDWTTTSNQTYQAILSIQAVPRIDESRVVARFALGLGHSAEEARKVTRNLPNVSMAEAVARSQEKILRYPSLEGGSFAERQAWAFHLNTLAFNTLTPADLFPGRDYMANAGEYAELPSNGRGRWNALWTHDTPLGLLGTTHVNPGMVLDTLRYFFDRRMDQSTGFLYFAPAEPGLDHVQIGSFLFARLLRRYLAHTGDITSAAALYPKLKLMWDWWITNSPGSYRHPSWPTVKLFTTAIEHETQEAGIVTAGGVPAGDDWATAWAYEFCVQMAGLSTATGNTADTTTWNQWATDLRAAIQTYCWSSSQGWFQPVMTGGANLTRFSTVRTYRAFNHLWAGTATPAQAAIMRDQIMDTDIFMGIYGVRTADKRWAGYAPNDWVNGGSRPYYDAAVSTGFRRYGFDDEADDVLANWTRKQNVRGTTPEMINPDQGTGGFARFLFTGNALMEAYLAKCDPDLLYVGVEAVTS